MTVHERIRSFNTRDTYPDQGLDNDLCQAVRAGNLVFLRGQVGTDFDGNLVGGDDPAAQARQAMKNVAQLLEEAGSELGHVCKIVIYLVDRDHRDAVYREIGSWLKGVYPVSTGVYVAGLAKREWLMEVDVTAVIPE
jgi:enamine deaminase RidA (YjgF/YER057c/UK114 family)